MQSISKSRWLWTDALFDRPQIAIFFVIGLFATWRCFSSLGTPPYARWDEETNVGVVTETLSSHSGPVLRFQNKPFFEKPPLWYFTEIEIAKRFGVSQISMRIVSALSGIGIIFLTTWIGSRWFGITAGAISGFIVLTIPHLYVQNPGGFFSTHTFRSADSDTLQQLFMLVSVWLFYHKKSSFWYIGAGVSALGFLTKGPLSILPLFFGFLTIVQSRKNVVPHIMICACIFVGLVAPWYVALWHTFGQSFIEQSISYHMIARSMTALEGHTAPFWFYMGVLKNTEVFPYFWLLIASLPLFIIRLIKHYDYRFFTPVMLVFTIFLIVSVVQTKLAWYITAIYPYGSLMIGYLVSEGIGFAKRTILHQRKTGFRRLFCYTLIT